MKLISDQRLSALELTKAKLTEAEESLKHKVCVVEMTLRVIVDFMIKWKSCCVLQEFIFAQLGYLSLIFSPPSFWHLLYYFYLPKDIVLAEHKKLLEEQKLINKGYTEVNVFGVLIRVILCPVALIGIFIKELCAQWRCASVVSRLEVVMALTRVCFIYRWAVL